MNPFYPLPMIRSHHAKRISEDLFVTNADRSLSHNRRFPPSRSNKWNSWHQRIPTDPTRTSPAATLLPPWSTDLIDSRQRSATTILRWSPKGSRCTWCAHRVSSRPSTTTGAFACASCPKNQRTRRRRWKRPTMRRSMASRSLCAPARA
jgi:hypothetical protein